MAARKKYSQAYDNVILKESQYHLPDPVFLVLTRRDSI